MLASLPMYDLEEVREATDAWWSGLARAFRREGVPEVPDHLFRERPVRDLWRASRLLFSQTCGYPLVHEFASRLAPLATPCYAADGCAGPAYCSFLIVRADDAAAGLEALRGRRVAVNAVDSQSGWNVLRRMTAPLAVEGPFFADIEITGSHLASIGSVASGRADLAAVDCVLHALLSRHRPQGLAATRVLLRSPATPGLPYVTAASAPQDLVLRLRCGLFEALEAPRLAACREVLLLAGAEVVPLTAYQAALTPEGGAAPAFSVG